MTKKIVSIVLAMCMVLSMCVVAGFSVSAATEDAYFVVGTPNLCGKEWVNADPDNQMQLNEETGLYERTYEALAPDLYLFKVTNGTWDDGHNWGGVLGNYYLQIDEVCDVTVQFNPATDTITCVGDGIGTYQMEVDKLYAVGNGEDTWLNDVAWDPAADANEMTEIEPGVYQITFEDVFEHDAWQIKFSAGSWSVNWGAPKGDDANVQLPLKGDFDLIFDGANCIYNIPCDMASVTFTVDLSAFDTATGLGAKVTVESVPAEDAEYYTVAGPTELCGVFWTADALQNIMYYNADHYEKTFKDLAPGTYQCKVTDGSWDNSWGAKNGDNFSFVVGETCDVTVCFDDETKEVWAVGDGLEEFEYHVDYVTIVGSGDENWLNNVEWGENSPLNKMTMVEDGVYQFTGTDLPEFDNYLFKFAANGSWDISWGGAVDGVKIRPNAAPVELAPNGKNLAFETTDIDNYTITLDISNYDPETGKGAFVWATSDEEAELDTALNFIGANMTFSSGLVVNYYIDQSVADVYEDLKVVFIRQGLNGADTRVVYDGVKKTIGNRNVIQFDYDGISPQLLGDEIKAVVYGRSIDDLTYACSAEREYNGKTYVYNQLHKANATSVAKTLYVDLLTYCAAGQTYTGYKADTLVTADLTDDEKALGTQENHQYTNLLKKVPLEGATVDLKGANVIMGATISPVFYFQTDLDLKDVTIKVSIGNREDVGVYTAADFTAFNANVNQVMFDQAFANELSDKMVCKAYDKDGNVISPAIEYSVESYVARQLAGNVDAKTSNFLNAMMNYGYSVMAFSGKTAPVV